MGEPHLLKFPREIQTWVRALGFHVEFLNNYDKLVHIRMYCCVFLFNVIQPRREEVFRMVQPKIDG